MLRGCSSLLAAALLVSVPTVEAAPKDPQSWPVGDPAQLLDLSSLHSPSLAPQSLVAAGDFDPTFGSGGMALYSLGTTATSVDSTLVQPDNKIIVSGSIRTNTGCKVYVARYNADGSTDTTFAGGTGIAVTQVDTSLNGHVARAALQADGKIVVASVREYTTGIGETDFLLLRYTASGVLDSTFGSGGLRVYNNVVFDYSSAVAIQPDGKILLAGSSSNNSDLDFVVLRFTTTGALDTSFGIGGKSTYGFAAGSSDRLNSIALQPDGKIVAVGLTSNPSSTPDFGLVRFTASGSLDSSFGGTGALRINFFNSTDQAAAVAVQTDGKILVAGNTYYPTENSYYLVLLRLNAAGSWDSTFNGTGRTYIQFEPSTSMSNIIKSLKIQADGKILAGGHVSLPSRGANFDVALLRFLSNGSLDSSFLGGGGFYFDGYSDSHDLTADVQLQSDGKLIVGGSSTGAIRLTRHGN